MNNARTIISNSGCLNLKQDIRPNILGVLEKKEREIRKLKKKKENGKREDLYSLD